MRTIGKLWATNAPYGDYPAYCDYCGVKWRRSQLTRDGDGLFRCPDEGSFKSRTELDRGNAAGARRPKRRSSVPKDGKQTSGEDP